MGLLLVTVALVSALVTMRLAVHGREVEVPDVRGRTPAEARRIAEGLGLAAETERQYYSATVAEGRVLSQTPEPGTVVRRGWELSLAVSLGPQRVKVPQVVGTSLRAASITLQQRGLDSSISEIALPGATAGQVLGQDPPADALDVATPKVNLLVAQEFSDAYVMPNFVGRPLGSVALAIKDAGFTLGKVTVGANGTATPQGGTPTDTALGGPAALASKSPQQGSPPRVGAAALPSPAAIVIAQQPGAGQKIVAAAEIRLVVR